MVELSELRKRIIADLRVKPVIDAEYEAVSRIDFIKTYARLANAKGLVLGISGGQDSTLAGRLCQLAAEQLRVEGYDFEFIAVRLPYKVQRDEVEAQRALQFIRPDTTITYNIADAVDEASSEIEDATGVSLGDFHKGNVKARMRMIAQFAIAGERQMLVVGTDHAAEAVTGFFTKFGDGAADLVPLDGLTKGQGAQVLEYLEADSSFWLKTPTADLLDSVPGQSDEVSLGVSYQQIDAYLTGQEVSHEVSSIIERRFLATEHKRHLPVSLADSWWREDEKWG